MRVLMVFPVITKMVTADKRKDGAVSITVGAVFVAVTGSGFAVRQIRPEIKQLQGAENNRQNPEQ